MNPHNPSRRTRVLPTISLTVALAVIGLMVVITVAADRENPATVSGVVVDASGPVAGARVRVRATDKLTFTNASGQFTLTSLVEGQVVELAAWMDGAYIASTIVTPTAAGITLTLRPYHQHDHPDYAWVSPVAGTSTGACGNCHPMIVSQWITNAHGSAVSNPRFFSLYNGTDLTGTVAVGPGYVNDFPGTAGNCANCHAPAYGIDGYLTTPMNDVRDEVVAGIHCDYCHKIGGVYLNPATQSVYANVPGAQSTRMLRPPPGDNIFFGPYDDIHDPDTYLPEISESQYCASCHQFSFWGTPIYESYEEWLNSDYAVQNVTCQNCHMPPNGDTMFALPEVGGLEHPPESIPSHLDLGASSVALLQNTVTMAVAVTRLSGEISVTVILTNTGAGHHVPTDYPGRHLILTVTACDDAGLPLIQIAGPSVPEWGGAEAGLPGVAFAKVLRDVMTGEMPVVSYWKQTLIASDNRIPALGRDVSGYAFVSPTPEGPVTVIAELRFRRVFQAVLDAKGWATPDILMERLEIEVP